MLNMALLLRVVNEGEHVVVNQVVNPTLKIHFKIEAHFGVEP